MSGGGHSCVLGHGEWQARQAGRLGRRYRAVVGGGRNISGLGALEGAWRALLERMTLLERRLSAVGSLEDG